MFVMDASMSAGLQWVGNSIESMTSALLTIDGTVTIRERIAVPDGSVASIKLVDSSGEVLADGYLLLWAAFRTDIGLWGTPDLVPATGDTVELVLQKIET